MAKNITIGVLALALIVLGAFSVHIVNLIPLATQYGTGTTDEFNIKNFKNTVTFSGSTSLSGTATFTGALVPNSVGSGVLAISGGVTSTVTAAQMCANSVLQVTATNAVASTTLPTAVALQAACLNTIGGARSWMIQNLGTATTSLAFVAGASTTVQYGLNFGGAAPSSTITGLKNAVLRLQYVTSTVSNTGMVAGLVNLYQ